MRPEKGSISRATAPISFILICRGIPSRLEQRNGRIDRKLQPAKQIICRYFRYEQREADIVLEALVRKTETIREQLGSVGQVIEDRIAKRLAEGGILRGQGAAIARAIAEESDADRLNRARAEMDDDERARHERLLKEQTDLQRALERSRERVGVDPEDLHRVAAAALSRAGYVLDDARDAVVGNVETYRLNPAIRRSRRTRVGTMPSTIFGFGRVSAANGSAIGGAMRRFVRSPSGRRSWATAAMPRTLCRCISSTGLSRRLLSRFLSQGFQSKLSRVSVIFGPGAQPRVVLMGRLAVFGAGAARLHEEVIPITAIWTESERDRKPLRPLGESGEEKTLNQLEAALRDAREASGAAVARIQTLVAKDIADLVPALEKIAAERLTTVTAQLQKRGEEEARSLSSLLEQQRSRIAKAAEEFDPNQLTLNLVPEERREREADRRHWVGRLTRLEGELRDEPKRLRDSYEVRAHRLEPVGLVYLWPVSG